MFQRYGSKHSKQSQLCRPHIFQQRHFCNVLTCTDNYIWTLLKFGLKVSKHFWSEDASITYLRLDLHCHFPEQLSDIRRYFSLCLHNRCPDICLNKLNLKKQGRFTCSGLKLDHISRRCQVPALGVNKLLSF